MGRVIVIGSQKGGVGKTTTTFNLAYILSRMGKRVLAVDFDSQANHTTCYRIEKTEPMNDAVIPIPNAFPACPFFVIG